ncbi:MAG TPA: PaaI family thioesterase [Mycobacteriales bacterium]|nr:PaaI family thioesterase [Mycobacteriales bacterium]
MADNAALRDAAIANVFERNPFVQLLGIGLQERTMSEVTLRMPFRPVLCNTAGVHHGGAIGSFIDTAGAVAVWNTHDFTKGKRMATLAMTTQYVGVAPGKDLLASARCTKRGRGVAFVHVLVVDTEGVLIADALGTYRLSD